MYRVQLMIGGNGMDLDLVPGLQSVTFEFAPVYAMRFEFRENGTTLPVGPQVRPRTSSRTGM